uniref:Cytosolic fatty-acid binding proteins domain-containing protein n=1 Tax=Canis lupus familiaris TaxID=9615 RepID=A0A8C0MC38_CANLF
GEAGVGRARLATLLAPPYTAFSLYITVILKVHTSRENAAVLLHDPPRPAPPRCAHPPPGPSPSCRSAGARGAAARPGAGRGGRGRGGGGAGGGAGGALPGTPGARAGRRASVSALQPAVSPPRRSCPPARRPPPAARRLAMPNFAGTWKMRSSENFDELLKALGVNAMLRKVAVAAASKPHVEIRQDGDQFYIKTSTTVRTTEINFKVGEGFEEETVDGRKCRSLATWENENKIHCTQTLLEGDGPKTYWTRELANDELILVRSWTPKSTPQP